MRNLTMRWTAAACCALSACFLAPGAARAQGSPPPTAADDDVPGNNRRAAQLYLEGNEAFKEKRWSDAELLYLKAWALVRSFDIAANLGEVQLKLNKPRSAAAFLAFSLRTAPPSAKPPHVERVRRYLDEARKQVGAVRLQGTDVADAEVFVDGERVPAEEVKHEIYVEPGEHRIVIRRAGYEEVAMPLMARAGVRETVPVAMKPVEVKAPETTGAGPEATKAAGAGGENGAAASGDAKTKAPAAGARVEERRSWVPVIALGTASVVGLGVAVGFTVASNSASADAQRFSDVLARANEQCIKPRGEFVETCTQTSRAASRAGTTGDLAFGSYIVSGALALAVLTYAVWPAPPKSTETGVRVAPFGGSRTAGIIVAGAW
ncbi:hypothetical protein [Sorangium sp. So ce1000]|uniref:hypothetical protein n=1 Tax=Sorangium sp. So ce1000 TaxID=3133325 RepID=UPI003F6008C4